jgi:hypothetical protein
LTFGRYLAAAAWLAVVVGAAVFGAANWRRRFAPEWRGALAGLADVVLGLSGALIIAELLGTAGRLEPLTFAASAAIVGVGSAILVELRPPARPPTAPRRRGDHLAGVLGTDIAALASSIGLATAVWVSWVANGLRFGIGNSDSLWYHLPFAAGFAESGSTAHAQFVNSEALVTYYPANVSLLHALGFLATGTDFLSPFVNLLLLPVALLAGWCIGEAAGMGASVALRSTVGVAVGMTIPLVALSEAGTAKDDLLSLVGLLAAVVFVIHPAASRAGRAAVVLSGLAAGIAVGTKLTVAVPVAALFVCIVIGARRGTRASIAATWAAAAFVTGGYWYVRNLFIVGSPIPSLHLGVGSFSLPRPAVPSQAFSSTVANHVFDFSLWRRAMLPGLTEGFGPAWPIVLGVTAAAIGLALTTRRRVEVIAAVVALAALVAYLVTPGGVYGTQAIDVPGTEAIVRNLFAYNLRYLLPTVTLALALLPVATARWRNGRLLTLGAFGAFLAATQLSTEGTRSLAAGHNSVVLVVGAGTVLAVAAAFRPTRRRAHATSTNRGYAIAAAALVAAVAIGWPMQVGFRDNRFATLPLASWANELHGARIGYAGFAQPFLLYGAHLDNQVINLGEAGPNGAWGPVRSCATWRAELRAARLDYVIVPIGAPSPELGYDLALWRLGLPGGQPPDEPPQVAWTRSDPEAQPVFTADGATVYAITGRASSAAGCEPIRWAPQGAGGRSRRAARCETRTTAARCPAS